MKAITAGRARAALTVGLGAGLLVFTARCSSSSSPGGDNVTTLDGSDTTDTGSGGGGDGAAQDGGNATAPDGSDGAAMGNDSGSPEGGDAGEAGSSSTDASGDAPVGATDASGDSPVGTTDASSDAPLGTTDAASDAPVDTGASVDADLPDVAFYDGGDGGACNSLANGATAVTPTRITGTMPAGTGGTVEQGLYYLTAVTEYVTPDGGVDAGATGPLRETLELLSEGGGTFRGALALEVNSGQSGQGSFNANVTETYTSNTAGITYTCNAPGARPTGVTYTFDTSSTPHQLHAFEPNYSGQGIDGEFTLDLQ